MNKPIRVMLCDDSALMRRLIKTAMKSDPDVLVVSEAENGQDALDKLFDAKPDIIVMDVEMPVMDGIDAVRHIRKRTTKLPIIMFSSLTKRGAEATLDAVDAGATDFATKPANAGQIGEAMAHVRNDLIKKIHQWARPPVIAPPKPIQTNRPPQFKPAPEASSLSPQPSPVPTADGGQLVSPSAIAIGVSTGGPQALAKLVTNLPVDFPVPILIAQHMPPVFTGLLAKRLNAAKGHDVREATDGDELRPGQILIAPGDHHMVVTRDSAVVRARLNQDAPENSCRPAVDPLFRSIAKCFGKRSLGVILTGMGKDGEKGALELRNCGARIFVQDEASSVVWGMPGNLVRCGLADRVLPLEQIAMEMIRATECKSVLSI